MRKSLLILITLLALAVSGAVVPVYADEPPAGCYYGEIQTPGFVCTGGVCCPGLRYEAPSGSVDGAVYEAPPPSALEDVSTPGFADILWVLTSIF